MQEQWRVLITPNIAEIGVRMLKEQCEVEMLSSEAALEKEEMLKRIAGSSGLCCGAGDVIDAEIMDGAPNLRVIARYGVGYDKVDLQAASRRGILVTNTPGVLTEAVAEMTWCLLLGLSRRIVYADRFLRSGQFSESVPKILLGTDLKHKTLGIVGAGRIGTAVAKRSAGFEMKILYYDLVVNDVIEVMGGKRVGLEDLLRKADIVTVHLSLNDQTVHFIAQRELLMMKSTAYLVNTSRGSVVDGSALLGVLEKGQIGGAALDVHENEPKIRKAFFKLQNVVLTPHIATRTTETRHAMAVMMAQDCLAALRGEKPPHLVNKEVWNG